jgi:hypothetical protein
MLCDEGFGRGSELEAFAGCEVEGHGDLLDVHFVEGVEICVATEPLSDTPAGIFATTLERVVVETVEARDMTKDLALLVGPDQKWLTTMGLLEKVEENLNKALAG